HLIVANAVVGGEREHGFASALPADERLLLGRARELEIDADVLALRRGHQQPAVVAQSLVLRQREAEAVDVELKGLMLIVDEERKHGESHRYVLLRPSSCRDRPARY